MRFLILFLILAAQGWGATYYVDYDNGLDTNDGLTLSAPKKTIQAAIDAGGAGVVVRPLPGVHVVAGLVTKAATATIQGYGADKTIIDGTNAAISTLHVDIAHDLTLSGVTLRSEGTLGYLWRGRGTATVTDCIFEGTGAFTGDFIYVAKAQTFTRTIFRNRTGGINIYGGGATFNYCIFENVGLIRLDDQVSPTDTYFYNCILSGSPTTAILIGGATDNANLWMKNCHIEATPNANAANNQVIANANPAATVILDHCNILTGTYNFAAYVWTNITLTNDTHIQPMFRAPRRPAVVVLSIDDTSNFEHWDDLADIANTKGLPMTLNVNTSPTYLAAETNFWARLTARVAEGHGVASHARSGNLHLGDHRAITLASTLAVPTVSIDVAGDYLKIYSNAVETYSVTLAGKEISDLITELAALANVSAVIYVSPRNLDCLATDLADITGVSIAGAGAALSLDPDRLAVTEMVEPKAAIESGIAGYTVKGFQYPRNSWSEEIIPYVKAAGYLGAGSGEVATMANLSMYKIHRVCVSNQGDAGCIRHDHIAQDVASLTQWLSHIGGIAVIYGHGASVFSTAQWTTLMDEVKKSNVQAMTLNNAIDYVIANGTTADDGLTYTRTFTDAPDYRLNPRSPLINAGVDVGLTTDIEGRAIRGLPDIGAYEFAPAATNTILNRILFKRTIR